MDHRTEYPLATDVLAVRSVLEPLTAECPITPITLVMRLEDGVGSVEVKEAEELATLKAALAEDELVAMVNASMRIAFALVDTPADEFLGESLEITRAIRNHCGLEE